MCKACPLANAKLLGALANAGLPGDILNHVEARPYHFRGPDPYLCAIYFHGREVHRVYGLDDLDEFLNAPAYVEGMVRTLCRIDEMETRP